MTRLADALHNALGAFVRVGHGRGFIGEAHRRRVVVTAAHCLPHLPPAHPASYADERTFQSLVGALGATATISVECLFVDPVADIAVLGAPDRDSFPDEAEAFEVFTEERTSVTVQPRTSCQA